MQNLESEILFQETFLNFIVNALAFVFIGACLTCFVAMIIWLTSGGSESRNDTAMSMLRSAIGIIVVILICYFGVQFYANFIGISLK